METCTVTINCPECGIWTRTYQRNLDKHHMNNRASNVKCKNGHRFAYVVRGCSVDIMRIIDDVKK